MKIKEHNGMKTYSHYLKSNYDGLLCHGESRVVLNGKVGISLLTKSYKFPNQIQFTMFTDKTEDVKFEKRNPSGYSRLEIDLDAKELSQLLYTLNEFKKILDEEG
jgi:hypothetical protein